MEVVYTALRNGTFTFSPQDIAAQYALAESAHLAQVPEDSLAASIRTLWGIRDEYDFRAVLSASIQYQTQQNVSGQKCTIATICLLFAQAKDPLLPLKVLQSLINEGSVSFRYASGGVHTFTMDLPLDAQQKLPAFNDVPLDIFRSAIHQQCELLANTPGRIGTKLKISTSGIAPGSQSSLPTISNDDYAYGKQIFERHKMNSQASISPRPKILVDIEVAPRNLFLFAVLAKRQFGRRQFPHGLRPGQCIPVYIQLFTRGPLHDPYYACPGTMPAPELDRWDLREGEIIPLITANIEGRQGEICLVCLQEDRDTGRNVSMRFATNLDTQFFRMNDRGRKETLLPNDFDIHNTHAYPWNGEQIQCKLKDGRQINIVKNNDRIIRAFDLQGNEIASTKDSPHLLDLVTPVTKLWCSGIMRIVAFDPWEIVPPELCITPAETHFVKLDDGL